LYLVIVAVGIATLVTASVGSLTAQPAVDPTVKVGAADVGGVVTSAHGPEAGVWVIARTDDLPTRYAKIVVTDDRGRAILSGRVLVRDAQDPRQERVPRNRTHR
jgi:hypothetical protein